MRLVGISMIKNGEDIVEAFVRHNLQFLDAMYILDNRSSDDTRAILDALVIEGCPLVILDDPEQAYFQSEKMTRLATQVAQREMPDFIFPIDDDEFIKCGSRQELEEELSLLAPSECGSIAWQTYVPDHDTTAVSPNPLAYIRRRRKRETPQYYKAWIPKSVFSAKNLVIQQGNHIVTVDGKAAQQRVLKNAILAHVPVRSPDQIVAKAVIGWFGILLRGDSDRHSYSYQWRGLYRQFLEDPHVSWADAHNIALHYAELEGGADSSTLECVPDPIEPQELKYTRAAPRSAFSLILRTIENILRATAGGPQERRLFDKDVAIGNVDSKTV